MTGEEKFGEAKPVSPAAPASCTAYDIDGSNAGMLTLDGSHGEGGGQLLRLAVGLSGVTGRSVRVENIRAKRAKPGLAAQHLTAVQAAGALCSAEVKGLELGSTSLDFVPGILRDGDHEFKVGTAGAVTLVLQAALPVALAAAGHLNLSGREDGDDGYRAVSGSVSITVEGGTDVRWAPPVDHWDNVFLGQLRSVGLKAQIEVERRGLFPKGGGKVVLRVEPARDLMRHLEPAHRASSDEPTTRQRTIQGVAFASQLPEHVRDRMASSARKELFHLGADEVSIRTESCSSHSPGGGLVLWSQEPRLGHGELAARGRRAEDIGRDCARELWTQVDRRAQVDSYAADQLLLYLALLGGSYTTVEVSQHTRTAAWVIEQFLPVRFRVQDEAALKRLSFEPVRFSERSI